MERYLGIDPHRDSCTMCSWRSWETDFDGAKARSRSALGTKGSSVTVPLVEDRRQGAPELAPEEDVVLVRILFAEADADVGRS